MFLEEEIPDREDAVRVAMQNPSIRGFRARGNTDLACKELVHRYVGVGDHDIKGYMAGRFHKMFDGTRKEYEAYGKSLVGGMVVGLNGSPDRPQPTPLQVALVGINCVRIFMRVSFCYSKGDEHFCCEG